MNAEILCVGTELLLGDTVNTNAAFIAQELAACGISCYHQSVVGDNRERLHMALANAFSHAKIVITTGGLGPTYDDLTKETVAAYFESTLILHESTLKQLDDTFRKYGQPMTKNNLKQAYIPDGAVVFTNDNGTAPGMMLKKDDKTIIMLPGPPREMHPMFKKYVSPYLRKISNTVFHSRSIHFFGIGESTLEDELREYMQSHSNPTIAPYTRKGEVLLRVTASAPSIEKAEELIQPVVDTICRQYASYIYGVDVDSLENAAALALQKAHLTLAVAEGITSGLLSSLLATTANSTAVFSGSICSSSLSGLMRLVSLPSLHQKSHQGIALMLARHMRKILNADVGCAVIGSADTTASGANDIPFGRIYAAISSDFIEDVRMEDFTLSYTNQHEYICHSASSLALNLILQSIKNYTP